MEVWLKNSPQDLAERCNGALQAFEKLADRPEPVIIVVSDNPDVDLAQMQTLFRLAERFDIERDRIVLISSHPSADWIEPLVNLGLKHLSLWDTPQAFSPSPDAQAQNTLDHLCPYLHAQTKRGKTLSLCGAGNNRIVLACKHMESWCLRGAEGCPHIRRLKEAARLKEASRLKEAAQ